MAATCDDQRDVWVTDQPPATEPDPPSLQRRGPARFDLTFPNGLAPAVSRGRVHLRAGQHLIIRIVSAHSGARAEVVCDGPLTVVFAADRVDGTTVPTVQAELAGRSRFKVAPFPSTGTVIVRTSGGECMHCRLTVPVTVWPSVWNLAGWWVAFVAVVLVHRWQDELATSRNAAEVGNKFVADLPYLGWSVPLGFAVVLLIWVAGWLSVRFGPSR